MTENHSRAFKGIWIPREIWLDQRLSYFEKCLLAEISSLDGEKHCYASNEYFAKFFNERIRKIQTGISKLKSLGYIEQVSFDGRTRVLKTTYDKFDTSNMPTKNRHVKFDTSEMSDLTPLPCQFRHPYSKEDNKDKKAASSLPKIDPLKFEHEIYQNDKNLYDKVIEWYSRKYAKKAPKSKLAVLKSCIKEKWYEEEVEEAKQNGQERDLNVKFAREVEKRYQRTDRPPLSDFKALKKGIVFISGTKEVTIPSYDMPHEIFKNMVKDIFESRGIWEKLIKVNL